MTVLTPEGRKLVDEIAQRHGVSSDAVQTMLMALMAGGGAQAQFSHPDLGGMGQWSQGGMIMVGDMFNQGLKFKVDSLCNELAGLLRSSSFTAPAGSFQSQSQSGGGQYQGGQIQMGGVSLFVPGSVQSGTWWPEALGQPASVGAQNNLRYAYFPAARRLAIDLGGRIVVYDTGDHRIGGFGQQQSGDQSLTFTSQHGLVRVANLPLVTPGAAAPQPAAPQSPPDAAPDPRPFTAALSAAATPSEAVQAAARASAPPTEDDIFAKIERLADLRKKEVLTQAEFDAKKAELLSRI